MRNKKLLHYTYQLFKPGGGPQRIKNWMAFMLLLQITAMIMPERKWWQYYDIDVFLLGATFLFMLIVFLIQNKSLQIPFCVAIFIIAMCMIPAGQYLYNSGKADTVLITGWSSVFYILERRQYISFTRFIYGMLGMMVALAISTYIGVLYPVKQVHNDLHLLAVGILAVGYNCYLLIIDFRHGKHRMDYFERHFDKIDELSAKLTKILMADKPINDIMWDVTRECIPTLGLEDFVIYLYHEEKDRLVQVAAYGGKSNPINATIVNPLEIEPGKGIVGKVFASKKPMLIADISESRDYIMDDIRRNSELAVPILIGDKVFGVIDSEHSQKGFFNTTYLQIFNIIAAFCSIKAAQLELRDQQLEAQKIKEFEQLKSIFVGNISHDLKTPLSLIMGPANQLFKTTEDSFVKQQAGYIIKNTDHLVTMVEQLLQLNMIEQGMAIHHPETIDLSNALYKMAEHYVPLAEEKSIHFKLEVTEDLLITTDQFKLSQCVHNLLQNAFKHTPTKGTIILSGFKANEDEIHILVKDTGIGIHPNEQQKIFQRFYKIDVNNHKGTGIGLSLVKEYVSQMNGTIALASTPNAGATFTIILPAQLAIPIKEKTSSFSDMTAGNEDAPLIMVVEDHEELNNFLSESLRLQGYKCLQTYNGQEAWEMAQHHLPDLIVTDLMMPKLSGEELVALIRAHELTSHIPAIVLTAKNQIDNRVELYQTGADNYLAKPFKMEELLAVIDTTLKQRKRILQKFYNTYLHSLSFPSDNENTVRDEEQVAEVNAIVKQCTDYVMAHLDDPGLNVTTLGAAIGFGRNRLQKEIKSATSLTPVEFIRSIRLHQAYKMLQESSQYNISEIAYMTGFSNLSYFSRSFKMQFGTAPTNVEKQQQTPAIIPSQKK